LNSLLKTKRAVLPEKEKRNQEINDLIKQLKNAKNIKDIPKCAEVFENLVKSYDKCKRLIEKEGHLKQYIRCLGEFESYIDSVGLTNFIKKKRRRFLMNSLFKLWNDSEWRTSASKNNSVALKKLRQRMNKYYKPYEEFIQDFKTNPDKYPEEDKVAVSLSISGDESDEVSIHGDEDEGDDDIKPTKIIPRVNDDDDDEDSDSMFDESDDDSDDDSSYDETKEGTDFIKQFIKKK